MLLILPQISRLISRHRPLANPYVRRAENLHTLVPLVPGFNFHCFLSTTKVDKIFEMPTSTTNIPRFLLPQLTWKATLPRSLVLATQRIPQAHPQSTKNTFLHRPLSTQSGESWRDTSFRSGRLAHIILSKPRPSTPRLLPTLFCKLTFHKPFSTAIALRRDHHFDTLKFVQRLKGEGFSEEQSKAMMLVLSDVIEESIQNLTRTMVLREGDSHFKDPHFSNPSPPVWPT